MWVLIRICLWYPSDSIIREERLNSVSGWFLYILQRSFELSSAIRSCHLVLQTSRDVRKLSLESLEPITHMTNNTYGGIYNTYDHNIWRIFNSTYDQQHIWKDQQLVMSFLFSITWVLGAVLCGQAQYLTYYSIL